MNPSVSAWLQACEEDLSVVESLNTYGEVKSHLNLKKKTGREM